MDAVEQAKKVFDLEISALEKTKDSIDDNFNLILNSIIECQGKVIITGMGKSGHIGTKLAATFSSLGTPSFYLHPAEALHGDLGMISKNDLVIAISYSGESDEIIQLLPNIRIIGARIIAISGNADSTLVKNSDLSQVFPSFPEACHLGLAPTSSTTATLVFGDALAVAASASYGFNDKNFGLYHPAGALGKKLILKVSDVMVCGQDTPIVEDSCMLTEAIVEMSKKGLGMVLLVDPSGRLSGIITDGDLRRMLEEKLDLYSLQVKDVMNRNPLTIEADVMAINALKKLREKRMNGFPVIDKLRHVTGAITLHLLIKEGIVL